MKMMGALFAGNGVPAMLIKPGAYTTLYILNNFFVFRFHFIQPRAGPFI
jgi:hypothetical protein